MAPIDLRCIKFNVPTNGRTAQEQAEWLKQQEQLLPQPTAEQKAELEAGCSCQKKKAKATVMKVIGAIVITSVFLVGIFLGSYLTRKAVNPA